MTVRNIRILAATLSRIRQMSRNQRAARHHASILLATLLILSASLSQAQLSPQAKHPGAKLDSNFGKIPLSFEPNRGQTDSSVRFLSRGEGYSLYLAADEVLLQLQKPSAHAKGEPNGEPSRQKTSALAMKLVDSNRAAKGSAEDLLPGTVNYFTGNDPTKWHTALPTYKRVAYQGVYPGVDLIYYGNQRELEYDFVVAPGADAGKIALHFDGASPRIDKSGDLLLMVAAGETRFHKPVVYQMDGDRTMPVEATYQIASSKVGFALGSYDHSKPLVIDPVLSYLTYIGGSTNDLVNGIAIDNAGSAYTVARSYSLDDPVKNAFQSSNAGGIYDSRDSAIAVTKFNATGTAIVYSTFLNGTDSAIGTGIAVDTAGNAYVVGYTASGDYPVTVGAFQTLCGAEYNFPPGGSAMRYNGSAQHTLSDLSGVLTKLNATGSALVYSTFLGGNAFSAINAVAVDAAGEAYVTGITYSYCGTSPPYGCFPTTSGAVQTGAANSNGSGTRGFGFFTKFDAAGANLLYSTQLGPNNINQQSQTMPLSVAVDAAGLGYIAGTSNNNLYTTPGSYQPSVGGIRGSFPFVAKFDPKAQALLYSTFVSGPTATTGTSPTYVAADAAGNAYLAGSTSDCSFPTTAGAYQTQAVFPPGGNLANCGAGFVSKLNPTGTTLLWSTFLGNAAGPNAGNATLSAIALGSDGSVYVGGNASLTYPFVNPVVPQQQSYSYNVISRLNPAGSALLFSTSLSGTTSSSDNVTGIAVDGSGNIYVAGQTNSFTLPVTPGVFQSTNKTPGGNSSTGFVAKIAPPLPAPPR